MATPLDERTIGNPPYDESAAIEAARHVGNRNRSLRSVLLRAFAGMGSFRQDQPLGANILNVLGGVGRATMAEQQQQSLDEYRAQQQALEERRLARLEKEKPAKPEKPPTDARPWYYREEFWDYPGAEALRAKAEYQKPPSPAKGPKPGKPEKPEKITRRIPRGTTEAAILRNIDLSTSETDLAELAGGVGEADSPAIRIRAAARLRSIRQSSPETAVPGRGMSLGQ